MDPIEKDPRYRELITDSEKSKLDSDLYNGAEVQWLGDQIGQFMTVRAIIDSDRRPASEEERKEAIDFYNGYGQWDRTIEKDRHVKCRPTLTINRLPELLAAAIANDPAYSGRHSGEMLSVSETEEIELAKVLLVRRNRDAQMMYNYMASTQVEFASIMKVEVGALPE